MKRFVYLLFAISGAIGLTYQVVWARLLLLVFGNTTHSLVTILSVFMAGLAAGSVVFGFISDKVKNHIKVWGILEILIGVGAYLMLLSLPYIKDVYGLLFNQFAGTSLILVSKFLLSSAVIFPTTFFMGGTLPLLIRSFASRNKDVSQETSKLYFVNTFGAFIGTLASAFVLIELFGLRTSVLIGVFTNIAIGFVALFFVDLESENLATSRLYKKNYLNTIRLTYDLPTIIFVLIAFFLSGAISLSYEIVWTRLLIPTLGTFVYAFSLILSVVLLGIALGSALAKYLIPRIKYRLVLFGIVEFGIGLFAVLSLLATGSSINLSNTIKLLAVLLPASVLMGTSFPVVASLFNNPERIGINIGGAYAANVAGSIVGPIVTGFFLIPYIGTSSSLITLALLNITLGVILVLLEERRRFFAVSLGFAGVFILVITLMKTSPDLFLEKSLTDRINFYRQKEWRYALFEDEVATTLAFSGTSASPDEKGLIIDGVQTTSITSQTKLLAHFPLLIHTNPKDVLVIAFGMGTTFRSALTHDVNVDAVELVPSVPKTFTLFFPDASQVLKNERGHIYINDGRNYVLFSDKKYDIIVVDPPPPINAAGTTVLYSKEFYEDTKKILREGGIFVQWFWYGASEGDFKMLFASFQDVFPNILVAVSPDGRGVFFLGSEELVKIDKESIAGRYKGKVLVDINEWREKAFRVDDLLELFVGDEKTVDRFVNHALPVIDDLPRTEYFYLRHKLRPLPDISPDWVHPIDPEFDKRLGIVR